jgi:primosomal protein N' (replication factor Y)
MAKAQTKSLFDTDEPLQNVKGIVIRVAFDSGVDSVFDYLLPESLNAISVGQRVQVPFGKANKLQTAFCVEIPKDEDQIKKSRRFKLKTVKKILDPQPLLDNQLMQLARWISDYYYCPLGQTLAAMVPAAVKKGAGQKKQKYIYMAGLDKLESEKLTSKKQKAIVEILTAAGALDPDTAIEKQKLLTAAQCTDIPLKNLSRKQIVRISSRTIIKSLPAIPQSLTIKQKTVMLNTDQNNALTRIKEQINAGKFTVTLLHGVTDSGKTELYIQAIQTVIKKGKSAIILLPEIALTTQTVQRFSSRFKNLAVMHSGLTPPQRNDQWQKIKAGSANVVIGARSAVFAPLDNLGLIVVDEEHEPSYKQDTTPRYHGRDVAIKRAQLAGALCLLGSATPALSTLLNTKTKKHYVIIRLPKRVLDLPMPEMKLVDLSTLPYNTGQKAPALISPLLEQHLHTTLQKNEQAILLLNRRGYSNFIFCPACKHTLHCRNCDITLTFHKQHQPFVSKKTITGTHMHQGFAVCHYCLSKTLVPQYCPLCKKKMTMIGLGSQRLTEELINKFPSARVHRVDSDSMAANPQNYYRLLADFADGKIDILAGTQILAKGLHFPNVTLVGIISADTSLALPDFRANERTFQLIAQVAGRAGRSEKGGIVIVQTFLPDQPAIKFALNHNYSAFAQNELAQREKCNLPPYWRMAIIAMRDAKFEKLQTAANALRQKIDQIITAANLRIIVRGPMPATISRIQRFHRVQIILQTPDVKTLTTFLTSLRHTPPTRPAVITNIDVDPLNLL